MEMKGTWLSVHPRMVTHTQQRLSEGEFQRRNTMLSRTGKCGSAGDSDVSSFITRGVCKNKKTHTHNSRQFYGNNRQNSSTRAYDVRPRHVAALSRR